MVCAMPNVLKISKCVGTVVDTGESAQTKIALKCKVVRI